MGIAALPDSVWLVAAALLLSEDAPAVLVLVPVAVLSEEEAEVVKVAPLVETAVEAETEAPVVAEALSVSVAVTVTGINAPPGISEIAMAEFQVEVVPRSSKVAPHFALVASYLQVSTMVLFRERISYDCGGGISGFLVGLETHISSMPYDRLTVEEPWATIIPSAGMPHSSEATSVAHLIRYLVMEPLWNDIN